MAGANLVEFQTLFHTLTDFPDKNVIDQLSLFAQSNKYSFATEVVDILCSRLYDINIPSAYKVPIFYLIDSIMKYTREPYVPLFTYYLEKLDSSFFEQFYDQHRLKLLKLFGTWNERSLLSPQLINNLNYSLSTAPYNHQYKQPTAQLHVQSNSNHLMQPVNQLWPGSQGNTTNGMNSKAFFAPSAVPALPNSYSNARSKPDPFPAIIVPSTRDITALGTSNVAVNRPAVPPTTKTKRMREDPSRNISDAASGGLFRQSKNKDMAKVAPRDPRRPMSKDPVGPETHKRSRREETSSEDDLLQAMQNILNQLLSDLGQSSGHLTLDDLRKENEQLYQDIRTQAEAIIQNRPQSDTNPINTSVDTSSLQQASFTFDNAGTAGGGYDLPKHPDPRPLSAGLGSGNNLSLNTLNISQTSSSDTAKMANAVASWNARGYAANRTILGFISEAPVPLSINRAEHLARQIASKPNQPFISNEAEKHCRSLSSRIQRYLNQISDVPAVPSILFGPLPRQASQSFLHSLSPQTALKVVAKIPVPNFRYDELSVRPDAALKALYADRPYVAEDGQRFVTPDLLRKHADKIMSSRIEKLKQPNIDAVKRRPWLQSISLWTGSGARSQDDKPSSLSKDSTKSGTVEEYIVPADENFVRCPITKEAFEKFWDDNEGEFMYRNAVKLLLTAHVDDYIYSLGRPTNSSDVRYMIVRKPLLVDSWIDSGKATTLPEAIKLYRSMGRDETFLNDLFRGSGETDEYDDVFVLLENNAASISHR